MQVAGGGGGIQVVPAGLADLAARLRADAAHAEQVAGAGGRACPATGCTELDAALAEYTRTWSLRVLALSRATGQLAQSVAIASVEYQATDAAAMRGSRSGP
jgi:hypothetical protein